MAVRIFLVEDEISIRDALKLNLELEGYEVVTTGDGKQVLKMFKEQHFDIVLLDIMLPEVSGLELCEQIRLVNMDIPIIFLTAKDTTADKVTGLKKGADDYIVKPFNLEELLLRIQILLKRSQGKTSTSLDSFEFGDNKANFKTFEATGKQGDFKLTKKEAMLLKLLIERRGEVVSRQQILQSVWGYDVYPSTRTIDNFILSFRKYFEEDPKSPKFFHSVRGVGYKFVTEEG
ncbi:MULTISPECIES: response regulator transcription factor [unclassified Aureispira]|uniref:response regulator transcription factor n=1 Tax=unclassified Aureispira TaxID=2649989 RepID=UPI000698F45D|nr:MULTISPECIES: response regulator transcription factor [unclassified Aureispira]WMX12626.1 response regulator transcription factor [Aureispira sp. CCB-E]